jgi:large subunit ribosomal protein L4
MTTVSEHSPTTFRNKRELITRQAERKASDGVLLGTVDLDPEWFGADPNSALMHQVVVAQLAAARAGTQSTRTRAEVAGGGAKPFRQKGMGRSRQGSIRSPQWVGGGVALGPKPRSYKQKTPKKMIRLALISALSDRAALGRVAVVDQWAFELPKTKDALRLLDAFGLDGRVLVVLGPDDVVAERSFGNLPRVETLQTSDLSTYDVLKSDWVLFTDESIPGGVGDVSDHKRHEPEKPAETETAQKPKRAPRKKAAAETEGATADEAGDDVTVTAAPDAEAVADTDADAETEPTTTQDAAADESAEADDTASDEVEGDTDDEDES